MGALDRASRRLRRTDAYLRARRRGAKIYWGGVRLTRSVLPRSVAIRGLRPAAELGLSDVAATLPGWPAGTLDRAPTPGPTSGAGALPEQLEVGVIEVPDALVVVDEGVVVAPSGSIVAESLKAAWAMDRGGVVPLLRRGGVRVESDRRVAVITNPAQRRSYGHWLLDALPRLVVLEQVYGDEPLAILVSDKVRGAYLRSLELYLPAHYRLLTVPAGSLAAPPAVAIPRFLPVPFTGALPPSLVDWFRGSLPESLRPAEGGSRLVFLSRPRELDRKLTNEDAVVSALTGIGFEVVRPERLSFDEQVALFGQARAVVGVHGSALTNVLYSPVATSVIELFPQSVEAAPEPPRYNALLAQSVGLGYRSLRGAATRDRDPFAVDVDELVTEVTAALESDGQPPPG